MFWSTGAFGAGGLILFEKLANGAPMTPLVTTLLAGAGVAAGVFLWKHAQLPAGTTLTKDETELLARTRHLAQAFGALWITATGAVGHIGNGGAAGMVSTALFGLALAAISSTAEGKGLRETAVGTFRRYARNRE